MLINKPFFGLFLLFIYEMVSKNYKFRFLLTILMVFVFKFNFLVSFLSNY
jgi:hypothetical protein